MATPNHHAVSILLVEDDPDASDLAVEHLEAEGWSVRTAATGGEAVEVVETESIGLVVLDLGLPDVGGLEVLGRIRKRQPDLPVIILTAQRGEPARVRGLWSGADDYLEKPFSPRELVARIRSVLRRAGVSVSGTSQLGALVVDHEGRTAAVGDQVLELTRLEFDVLAQLISHPGQVFSREHLQSSVWAPQDRVASAATVTEIVRRVRTKLDDADPSRPWIDTVRGLGYRFSVAEAPR